MGVNAQEGEYGRVLSSGQHTAIAHMNSSQGLVLPVQDLCTLKPAKKSQQGPGKGSPGPTLSWDRIGSAWLLREEE